MAGAKLVLTYNRTAPSPELRERCLRFGAEGVEFVGCDVSGLEGCEELVKKVGLIFFFSFVFREGRIRMGEGLREH